jgi:hypothetical protein
MTRARAPWTLALALVALTGTASANETQRIILDAGLNLGLWQAQVAIFDTAATEPSQVAYASDAFAAVEMVRQRLGPPFLDLDLQAVLDAIARYPERVQGLPARQRAIHVQQIRDLLHARLSVLYLSTVGAYAAPNCDGAFLDVGYHFGPAQMAAVAGDGATLANARSMLLQAIRSGLDAARSVGCGFNLQAVWDQLAVADARSAADYRALVEPVRATAQVASARFDGFDPWSPSDPSRDAGPPPVDVGTDIVGTWRYETGVHVVFRRTGEGIVGSVHGFTSTLLSLGYTEGMEGYRLQDTGPGAYLGQKAVRDSSGAFHWKDVRVAVEGDTATFSDLFDGGQVAYRATRER